MIKDGFRGLYQNKADEEHEIESKTDKKRGSLKVFADVSNNEKREIRIRGKRKGWKRSAQKEIWGDGCRRSNGQYSKTYKESKEVLV